MDALRRKHQVEEIGEVRYGRSNYPMYAITSKSSREDLPYVLVCAGIHGDEPAGVEALFRFMSDEAEKYKDRFSIVAIPCLNPSGYDAGTRDSAAGADINRDFLSDTPNPEAGMVKRFIGASGNRYALAFSLHEDNTDLPTGGRPLTDNPTEFYMYEYSLEGKPPLGRGILRELEGAGIQVRKSPMIYNDANDGGLIVIKGAMDESRPDAKSLEAYLLPHAERILNPETPTVWPFEKRVQAHLQTVKFALNRLGTD